MPDEPIRPRQPDDVASSTTEWTILDLLLDELRPWSTAEIGRELGDEIAAVDAVASLRAAGLIHRTSDGFVFVTRAAARFHEIAE